MLFFFLNKIKQDITLTEKQFILITLINYTEQNKLIFNFLKQHIIYLIQKNIRKLKYTLKKNNKIIIYKKNKKKKFKNKAYKLHYKKCQKRINFILLLFIKTLFFINVKIKSLLLNKTKKLLNNLNRKIIYYNYILVLIRNRKKMNKIINYTEQRTMFKHIDYIYLTKQGQKIYNKIYYSKMGPNLTKNFLKKKNKNIFVYLSFYIAYKYVLLVIKKYLAYFKYRYRKFKIEAFSFNVFKKNKLLKNIKLKLLKKKNNNLIVQIFKLLFKYYVKLILNKKKLLMDVHETKKGIIHFFKKLKRRPYFKQLKKLYQILKNKKKIIYLVELNNTHEHEQLFKLNFKGYKYHKLFKSQYLCFFKFKYRNIFYFMRWVNYTNVIILYFRHLHMIEQEYAIKIYDILNLSLRQLKVNIKLNLKKNNERKKLILQLQAIKVKKKKMLKKKLLTLYMKEEEKKKFNYFPKITIYNINKNKSPLLKKKWKF
jgi:hypothetical protein